MPYRSRRACPRCRRTLVAVAVEVGTAWGCEGCGGVLLDDAAFAQVREAGYELIVGRAGQRYLDLPTVDAGAPLACPECDQAMQRTQLDDVPVDFCREHGIWFDAQELLAIALALERSRRSSRMITPAEHLMPYAPSPETAEQLEGLRTMLRASIDRIQTAEALRRLREMRSRK